MQAGKCSWLIIGITLAICGSVSGQQVPMEPFHESGQSITGAFEGWFPNPDGTFSILLGYFNRNTQESMDIPIGPNNRIEPGGPDRGQPTHFLPGRGWGLFTITVPKDFGDNHLTWTIIANGKTTVLPVDLKVLWRLEPFVDATNNTPPYLGFSENGPFVNGPVGYSKSVTATIGIPLPLTVYVADDNRDPLLRSRVKRDPVMVHWIMFRGPGEVKFADDKPRVEKLELKSPPPGTPYQGKVTTTATFSKPGEYVLNLQADDATGGGPAGRQCCWSNAKVNVSVRAAAPGGGN